MQLENIENVHSGEAEEEEEDDATAHKDIPILHNNSHVIRQIAEEYQLRLNEQVTKAREDIFNELEIQIQVS